jgi:hypothetical protein
MTARVLHSLYKYFTMDIGKVACFMVRFLLFRERMQELMAVLWSMIMSFARHAAMYGSTFVRYPCVTTHKKRILGRTGGNMIMRNRLNETRMIYMVCSGTLLLS